MMSDPENKKTVEKMWNALSAMDWETLKSCLHEEIHYEDVPTDDPGARGRENVVKRLGIAFDHLSDHGHVLHHIAADGDVVFLDHTESWTFKTGEKAWTFPTDKPIHSSPSVAAKSGLVYFGCNDGKVYCLDVKTGAKQWEHATGGAVISSPWPEDGVIYVGSDDGFVYAVTGR